MPDAFPTRPTPSTLCLGGSFNPPHHGHLITAQSVAERAGFGRIRLVVAGESPHKPGDPDTVAALHRVALCRLAVAGNALFEVDDRETHRAGPSYTIETAEELQADPAFAGRPVHWLIGADQLPRLMTWHEAPRLLAGQVVQFLVMRRPRHEIDWAGLPPEVGVLRRHVVEVPQIDISATAVRQRVLEGRDIQYLVPEAVRQYIRQHGLYRD